MGVVRAPAGECCFDYLHCCFQPSVLGPVVGGCAHVAARMMTFSLGSAVRAFCCVSSKSFVCLQTSLKCDFSTEFAEICYVCSDCLHVVSCVG